MKMTGSLLVLLMLALSGLDARSAEVEVEADADVEEEFNPLAGGWLAYRNVTATVGLDKGAELTWNPYYAMAIEVFPYWWFNKTFYVMGDFAAYRELTNADATTKRGEIEPGDVLLGVGASQFLTIPYAEISFSARLNGILPTSKASAARTMIAAVRPDLLVTRTFPLLEGLTLGYMFRWTWAEHKYTTAERDFPLIPGCLASTGSCEEYLNTGERNAHQRLDHLGVLEMAFTDWLILSGTAGVMIEYLYPMPEQDPRVSFEPQAPTDERYTMVYELELAANPYKPIAIAVGTSTMNPQLRPDSTPQDAVLNRYTTFYVDLRLDFAGVYAELSSNEEQE